MIYENAGNTIVRNDRSVVTVGTYDGVHLGHQAILSYIRKRAENLNGISTVVSFDPHPREVVLGERVPLLTTLEERAALLEESGIDRFVVLPFTRDLSILEAEDYVRSILVETIGMQEIVIGYNHAFGRNRSGNRKTLEILGKTLDFTVDVIPRQMIEDAAVSSSRIRNVLSEEGDTATAARLLGRPYAISGTVIRGAARGRVIGYPTANLRLHGTTKLVPKSGVYAVTARIDDRFVGGMMNIGQRPTFESEGEISIETHFFDLDQNLYGRDLTLHFIERLRDEQRFSGVEKLTEQLGKDEQAARALLERA